MDQSLFLKQMQELVEFGRTKENVLTKEEIADYCSDLSLDDKQLELVYAYLKEHQIHVPGADTIQTSDLQSETKDVSEDSRYLKIYRKELKMLPERTKEEVEELHRALLSGDDTVIPAVIETHLSRVVTLAGRYKGRGVLLGDLIQEGNLELMTSVSMACGNSEIKNLKKELDHAIQSRLIELVDEELQDSDSLGSVLGRVNLLLEATKVLAEEYGRIATIRELSEFTHMDESEIKMYVEFTDNKIELGQG